MKYILNFLMSNQLKLLFVGDHLCGKTSFIMTKVAKAFLQLLSSSGMG